MRRLLGVGARWAAPSRASRWAVTAAAAVVAGLGWAAWVALLGAPPADEALARAYGHFARPPTLDRAGEAAWGLAVQDGASLDTHARSLLSVPFPPPICVPSVPAVDRIVRRAERSLERRDLAAMARAVDSLRSRVADPDRLAAAAARYAVARLQAGGGDLGAAARWTREIDLAADDGGRVPSATLERARAMAREGLGPSREDVVVAYHARYLAGFVARERERPNEAIAHYRRALNAVNHHLAIEGLGGPGGHYERAPVAPGVLDCRGSRAGALTSMDGYVGLVAAYLDAPDFRDSGALRREVEREAWEVDPGDPLEPALAYARRRATAELEIPEHLLWAASNLQRVHHHNGMRPDARLAGARAVLVLNLLDDDAWSAALETTSADRCAALEGLADGMRVGKFLQNVPAAGATRADSAWAAVAVNVFARLDGAECAAGDSAPLDEDGLEWREPLLALAGGFPHSPLIVRYEAWRRALETGPSPLSADEAARVMTQVDGDLGLFRRGRVPPEMSAAIDPATAASFVSAWRRAVFLDVAERLARPFESGGAPADVRAGEVASYLRALNASVAHAGLVPADVYRPETLALLIRSQGTGRALLHRIRYHARNRPLATTGALLLLTGAALTSAVVLFVGWWRFALLTRAHFYRAETGRREGLA